MNFEKPTLKRSYATLGKECHQDTQVTQATADMERRITNLENTVKELMEVLINIEDHLTSQEHSSQSSQESN